MKVKDSLARVIKIPVKQRAESFAPPLDYKVVSDKEMALTADKAFEFLELEAFEGERNVREHHVQYLFDEWVAGRFMWHHIILASVHLGDKHYRINGQHTCWMRTNIKQPDEKVNATVRRIEYQVDTEEQLRGLYSTFDRNATRSVGHIGKVLMIGTKAGRDLPVSLYTRLMAGFRLWFSEDWRHKDQNMSIADQVAMVENNYAELFNIVGRFVQLHHEEWSPWCRRAAVIAAIFATFDKNVLKAQEFWTAVVTGLGFADKSDPRLMLKKFVESHSHSTMERAASYITQEDLYRICVNLWNHWRQGNVVGAIRMMDKRPKARS